MRGGTRRMWSRRVLRAGWLIAPLFTLPAKVFGGIRRGCRAMFFDYHGKFETGLVLFFTFIIGAISFFVWSMVDRNNYVSKAADPDVIKEAMADPCVQQELLKRLNIGMIRGWDIGQAETSCQAAREQQEQRQMLEQQKAMLGVK